ncbi:hypothetical protein V6000_003453 [Aspergillus fumigatus]
MFVFKEAADSSSIARVCAVARQRIVLQPSSPAPGFLPIILLTAYVDSKLRTRRSKDLSHQPSRFPITNPIRVPARTASNALDDAAVDAAARNISNSDGLASAK